MQNRPSAQKYKSRPDSEIVYPASKRCAQCQQIKTAADFPKARREKDGLKSYCKECGKRWRADWYKRNAEREKAKVIAYREANPDKVAEWRGITRQRHGEKYGAQRLARYHERGDENRAARRERYATDAAYRDMILTSQAKAYRKNPEPMKQRVRQFREQNRDLYRLWGNNYRARRANADGECTPEEWQGILAYFDRRCAYCLRPESETGTLAMEHMLPLSRGGTNHPDNIVPGCKPCNSSKSDRTPMEFLAAQRRLECLAA